MLQFVLAILCTTIGRFLRTLTQMVSEPDFTLEDKIKRKDKNNSKNININKKQLAKLSKTWST